MIIIILYHLSILYYTIYLSLYIGSVMGYEPSEITRFLVTVAPFAASIPGDDCTETATCST